MDLQRGADAQQHSAPRQSSSARAAAQRAGSSSPNSTTSGPHRRAAALAAGHAVGARRAGVRARPPAGPPARTPSTSRWRSSRAPRPARGSPRLRWSMSTFWVMTASSMPARSIRTSASWARVGALVLQRGEALGVEAPEARRGRARRRRCGRPPSDRASPTGPSGGCGSRGCRRAPRCRRRSARPPSGRRGRAPARRASSELPVAAAIRVGSTIGDPPVSCP